MTDSIDGADISGKESLVSPFPGAGRPSAAGQIDILPPVAAAALADAATTVQRLARADVVPETLLAALAGPLGDAIATAAEYAGSALSEATKQRNRNCNQPSSWLAAAGSRKGLSSPRAIPSGRMKA